MTGKETPVMKRMKYVLIALAVIAVVMAVYTWGIDHAQPAPSNAAVIDRSTGLPADRSGV